MSATPTEQTVEQLWRGMHDRLETFVSRRTVSSQDAEDIVQDVFLRMHVAMQTEAATIDRVDAWMYRIARNAVVDGHRRRRPSDPIDEGVAADDDSDDAAALRQSLANCLQPFLDRLPEPYAQAVRWVDVEGVTQVEAARRARITVPGMKSRVQRGRAKLRELLDACCRFDIDARGNVMDYEARNCGGCTPGA